MAEHPGLGYLHGPDSKRAERRSDAELLQVVIEMSVAIEDLALQPRQDVESRFANDGKR